MKFYSRVDLSIATILLLPNFFYLYELISKYMENQTLHINSLLTLLCYLGFLVVLYVRINYRIKENQLIVTNLILDIKIDISKIIKIEKSKTLMAAPAMSLDRIKITYNTSYGHSAVIISPQKQELFLAELKKLNPSIEIGFKK